MSPCARESVMEIKVSGCAPRAASQRPCLRGQSLSSHRALALPLAEWYFDIETEGTDPQQDKILTVQYQPLDDGRPAGTFRVLAEWEWGEKQIVRSIVDKGLLEPTWDFVPVGNRLKFDITFAMEKAEKYDLKKFTAEALRYYWFSKPIIDLAPVLLMMNRGRFAGSSMSGFADKPSGSIVPGLYREGRFSEILGYVTREKDETLRVMQEVREMLEAYGDSRQGAAAKGEG